MRCLLSLVSVVLAGCAPWQVGSAEAGAVSQPCHLKGKPLFGKVQFVDAFADFTIEEVTSFPDLKVQKVGAHADACGQWQVVDAFPDFTVERVSAHADLKVAFVDAFPGLP